MSHRHTWTLVLIAGLLAGYVWFFEHPRSNGRAPAADYQIFPELAAGAATSLTLQNAAGRTLHLARTNGTWHLQEPIRYPAENAKIRALLEDLAQLQYQSEVVASPDDMKADLYGLETPAQSLAIAGGGVSLKLHIGHTESAGRIVFVRRSDQKQIYTVSADTLKPLEREANYWRDSRVFPHSVSQITDLILDGGSRVHLTRSAADADWKMIEPVSDARLDLDFLALFFQQLAELRVSSFDPTAEAERHTLLEFRLANGFHYLIELLGARADNPALHRARLGRSRTHASISAIWANQLQVAKAFRSPYLLDQNLQFNQITVRAKEKFTLSLVANTRIWQITEPNPIPVDNGLMKRFFQQLTNLRINEFMADGEVDEARFGLDFPIRTLTFSSPANTLRVRFGLKIHNNLMAHRSDEPSVYAVPYKAVFELPAYAWQLRDRKLWSFDAQDIATLHIVHPNQTTQSWQRSDAAWRIDNTPLGELETAEFNEYLYRLSQAMAESWTSREPNAGAQYGTDSGARIEIEFKDSSKTPPKRLKFGMLSPRGYRYAETEVDGMPTIFEFPGALYPQLNRVFGLDAPLNHP